MRSSAHRVVGIIGGMGPEATVELMRRVIAATPADDDQDHIHLIVESNPKIPSRIAHLVDGSGADPKPELLRIARNLKAAGADALAMPCNTAHCYAAAIEEAACIPLLDMVELTADRLAALRPNTRVGLLASTAVHRTGLYERALQRIGAASVLPRRQEELMELIKDIKRGKCGPLSGATLSSIACELAARSDILLIACTELSVLPTPDVGAVRIIDSLDVLTQAIVDFGKMGDRLPYSMKPVGGTK
jgi:aspartate racemase